MEYTIDGCGCLHLVLDCGKVNEIGRIELHQFEDILDICKQGYPNDIRLLSIESNKISAKGARIFCAGANQRERFGWSCEDVMEHLILQRRIIARLYQSRVYIICCVDGYALGLGVELCLAADTVIATERAVFGFPETTLGIVPGAGGSAWMLSQGRTTGVLNDLILEGRRFDANEAKQVGIVTDICQSVGLRDYISKYIKRLVTNRGLMLTTNRADYHRKNCVHLFGVEQGLYLKCLLM